MKIALVGSPNVGKSVIFHHLTGQYVTVSNYPGTTVEVTWGEFKRGSQKADIVDTPGIYSLMPISGEEQVTRELLFMEKPELVIHVIDAKNLQRMLALTVQLVETGLKVAIVLNMMDEARERGLQIATESLAKRLGLPVFPAVSVTGEGIEELKLYLEKCIAECNNGQQMVKSSNICRYPEHIEQKITQIQQTLKSAYPVARRSIALFLLQGDPEIWEWVLEEEKVAQDEQKLRNKNVRNTEGKSETNTNPDTHGRDSTVDTKNLNHIEDLAPNIETRLRQIVGADERREVYQVTITEIAIARQRKVDEFLGRVFDTSGVKIPRLQAFLSKLCTEPVTGLPILFLVLYFGIYKFVGGLGAGTLVDFFDGVLFQKVLNPAFTNLFTQLIPQETLRMLFVGDYGILTLGIRYAAAIILPVVGMFFFAFSILEDSGYFPRLALLIDRLMKVIGLNGRAVIPMILGLGCDTMATMTTRILETRRERLIATFLLALAIPCSAQLGVIAALLTGHKILVWLGVILGVLLAAGFMAGKLMPGEPTGFYMEVPTLRLPKLVNILAKTRARMVWYLAEILPVFIYSSVLIWVLQISGAFEKLLEWMKPLMALLGLPNEAAVTFLFGFFRRDYGAAGLFDLHQSGVLTGDGVVVACVTLTLFVPCIAQLAVMIKEQGVKIGLLIAAFVFPFAFAIGWLISKILLLT